MGSCSSLLATVRIRVDLPIPFLPTSPYRRPHTRDSSAPESSTLTGKEEGKKRAEGRMEKGGWERRGREGRRGGVDDGGGGRRGEGEEGRRGEDGRGGE